MANHAGTTMQALITSIGRVSSIVREAASANSEQSAGVTQAVAGFNLSAQH